MKRWLRPLAVSLSCLLIAPAAPGARDGARDVHPRMGVLDPAPGGAARPTGITGFAPDSIDAELAREAGVAAALRPDSARRHLRLLTEEPHVAGTPADRATAEYVRQRLAAYGWDAQIVAIPVWLNYPKSVHLELLEPARETLAVREQGAAGDKDSHDANVFDAFHGYAASGDVSAHVVYANYGDLDDFTKLTAMGIDLRGRIALVRYGKLFRGLKVRNAERAGMAGVIIYSDPADDGYAQADPYPRGAGRPEDAIQRGSVQFLSDAPCDPTTPGWASRENGRRLSPGDARGVPHIPSLPLAYAEARKILRALDGPQAPKGWQGGLPFTYHVGPGGAKVHMAIAQDYAVRPIWDVIATLKGREHPEQKVLLGNHRDAWTYGAVDPNSGTICLLELARSLGALAKTGWRPRRTIELCSWDGEEYGLLGSTEWAEANATDLSANAVAYLNVDTAVGGHDFRASGCHALRDVLTEAERDVREPVANRPLWNVVMDRLWSDGRADWSAKNRARRGRGEPERPFEMNVTPLGSGSDYTAFVDHLGVPALDMRFEGLEGPYHSMYDDFEYMDRIVDPGYAYTIALTDLWARVTLRLAEAEVLPLRYANTGTFALDELQSIEERAEDACAGKPDSARFVASLASARRAATHLHDVARDLERRSDAALAALVPWPTGRDEAVNGALIRAERALLGPGLPGREWFRHELYAPGLNTGYAAVPIPRLGQAVLDNDPRAYARGVDEVAKALEAAANELAKVQ
jgi:N-acetylated-alpha-linked acidic dipeptidase